MGCMGYRTQCKQLRPRDTCVPPLQERTNMSVAYYIVLDQEIDGLDAETDGKAFARHYPALDALALSLNLPEIDYFVSIDDEDLAALMGEDAMAVDEGDEEDVNWRSAEEGLAFFGTLATHLRNQPGALPEQPSVLAELECFIAVLQAAAPQGANFFLAIDF
jgi:hypothetical protein